MNALENQEDPHHWSALWALDITPQEYLEVFEGRKFWAPKSLSPDATGSLRLNANEPKLLLTRQSVAQDITEQAQHTFDSEAAQCAAILCCAYQTELGRASKTNDPATETRPYLQGMAEGEALFSNAPPAIQQTAKSIALICMTKVPKVTRSHAILALLHTSLSTTHIEPEELQERILCSISKLSL